MGEAKHFKFGFLIDTEKCMHDRLPGRAYIWGHVMYFNFWEITDNILEMVQYNIVAVVDY